MNGTRMCSRPGVAALLVLVAAACSLGDAIAQGLQKVDAPIDVTVKPALSAPGASVKISGTSVPMKEAVVTVTVKPPQGAVQTLTAKPAADGTYSVTVTATKVAGRYDVTATAPDGKAKAQGSFFIGNPGAATQALVTQLDAMLAAVTQAQAVGDQLVATLPPSPAQLDGQKKSATLKAKLADGHTALAALGKSMEPINQLVQDQPDAMQALQPLYDGLADDAKELETQSKAITDKVAKSKAEGVKCDMMDAANEAFNAVSFGLDIAKKPSDLIKNFLIDKGPGPVLDIIAKKTGIAPSDAVKFEVIEKFKTAVTSYSAALAGGPAGWTGIAIGLANDMAQYYTAKVFSKYCEKFEGPMDGQFRVELRTENQPYLQYLVKMQGKIVLRYAKGDGGAGSPTVAISGQIEGNAIAFQAWEEAFRLDTRIQNSLMARLLYPPIGVPYIESAGSIARAASPGNFYIPVHGQLVNGKMKLQIDPARNDFTDLVRVRLYYVFMALVPQIEMVELPVQKAFFIFDRGLHSKPEFDIKTDSTSSTLENVFKRDETVDNGQVNVQWNIHIKACNPGCLPIRA